MPYRELLKNAGAIILWLQKCWVSHEQLYMRKLKNMGYNRFYINVFLNVILIAAACLAFVFFLFIRVQPATATLFGFFAIFFTGRLIYYINRTNRILDNFIIFMKEHDPTLAISSQFVKKTFHGFYHNLQKIKDEMLSLIHI